MIKTPFGCISADIKTTYHINWLTYAYNLNEGQVGLEDVVKNTYGKNIEMESSNDTDYSYTIRKEKLTEYDIQNLEAIVKSGSFEDYNLRLIMTDLANKDIIPEGSYVVTMSW